MNGKLLKADEIVNVKKEVLKSVIETNKLVPHLTILQIGDNKASNKYIKSKIKLCKEIKIDVDLIKKPENIDEIDFVNLVEQIGDLSCTDGLIVQLPLPKHLEKIDLSILMDSEIDVDGFTNVNLGKLLKGENYIVPCTPKGIIELLKYYNIKIEGKDVVIINRSNIVGKPLAMLILQNNGTPIICHSKTKDLKEKIKNADIVVTGVGIPKFLNHDDFSENTTIVDVSINVDENGKLCGDVDKASYDKLLEKGCNITPVPGGVGLMTVISLAENIIDRFQICQK